MGDWPNFENRAVIGKALRLRREIDDFEARWPALAKREELLPSFSWTQLERQLVDLPTEPQGPPDHRPIVEVLPVAHGSPPLLPAHRARRRGGCLS